MSIRSLFTRRRVSAVIASIAVIAATPGIAQAAPAGSPIGNLDSVTIVDDGVRVRGWVWDKDTTAPVAITVAVGSVTHELTATAPRADVARAFPAAGDSRGFDVVVPGGYGPTEVCVTGHNVGAGADFVRCTTVAFAVAPPRGWLERVTDVDGQVAVKGWAGTPGTSAPVTVRLTSGSTTQDVSATAARADVARIFPDLSGTTGFTATLSLGAGTHTVCATALNAGTGPNTEIGCRTVTTTDHSPTGAVLSADDAVGGLRVRATAADVDAAEVTVRVTAGGVAVSGTTDAYGVTDVLLPVGVGTHEVCATAVNVGPGTDTSLGCTQGTVLAHSPVGQLTSVSDAHASTTGLQIRATTSDIDATAPLTIALTIDGTRNDITANAAGTIDVFLPVTAGSHTVCATAVNVGQGDDTSLGCLTATAVDHRPVGNLDSVVAQSDGARLLGWATDPDSSDAVTVRILADGTATTVSADAPATAARTTATTTATSSGFDVLVPLAPGSHEVCVIAVNIGAGSDTELGCSTVIVPEPEIRMPDAGNTGVRPGTQLTVRQGDLVITTPGTVIDGWDIRGYVEIKASGVVIRNSILRGGTLAPTAVASSPSVPPRTASPSRTASSSPRSRPR